MLSKYETIKWTTMKETFKQEKKGQIHIWTNNLCFFSVSDENLSGIIINAFALIAKSCVSAAWCAVFVLSTEVYPTVVR